MMLDCGDGLLQGILFDVTWNQWEETETDTSTGQSETHYTRGHEVLATDQSGKADLFVTSCFCDDLAALDLRIQVVASPGYRLVRRYHLNNHWNFGFQSESVPQEGHIDWDPPHPILCDLRVRQAIAHCIDRRAMIASVYPYIDDPDALLMDSFLPKNHWAYEGPYEDMPQYDPEAGMALLEEAGWTLPDGATVRQNATGEPLTLEFTTTNAQYRQTWGAVFVQNMADCGIEIVPNYVPASWWFGDTTGLVRRDFELGAFAWVSETDPGGRTLYGCNQTPLPSNNWEGQNYMGWCNETASAAIIKATSTVDRNERIAAYDIVQEEFAKDVVSIPLFQRAEAEAWSANLEGVRPDPTEYATTNLHEWTMADGSDTIVIGMTQEPDSLWAMTASNTASALVRTALGSERTHTEYAYDFQPRLQEPLSTIDSGLAANNDVEVNAGDIVLDKYGDAVDLGEWDSVFDNDGNEVEFDGTTPITMKQLVITYRFKPYNWSDGTPGSIADFQLGQKIDCDPEISYWSSVRCDTIQSVDWAGEADEGLEYTVTYLPGAQAPTYFLAPFTPYPSARVLADGRVLADVPAEEWRTLPEINEMPLSWGPYRIVAWDKGRSITLEQNPYYDGGVATPNVVFVLLADRSQALAQLLSGEVDYLDGSTLLASAQVQTVLDAANSTGAVQYEIIVSPTWEHVDINLLIR
jgi:ABC-type transport system substrate-binding protein